ncbi:MAG: hypothetical protein KAV87_31810 [Desulfobacteraceae bacterium]|nr:hypothetical protein [Desulfobacteraceae bacterium]
MICPIIFTFQAKAQSMELVECRKEKCAWWVIHEHPNAEGCAIAELSNNLKTISLRIAELSMKMDTV